MTTDRRVEFCQIMQEYMDFDPNYSKKILFSDGAIFYLNGHVNRHNMRYWSDTNPHWPSDTIVIGDERLIFGVKFGVIALLGLIFSRVVQSISGLTWIF